MDLQDFETLEDAKAYSKTGSKMISPDMMVAFLATFKIGRAVDVEDSEAAFALRNALQFGSEFNLIKGHPASVEPLLNQVAAASDEFKDYAVAYANPTIKPFADVTLTQFNRAKGIYTEEKISNYNGNDLKITLISDLPENCTMTTWEEDSVFQAENFGKIAHLKQGVNTYKLKTDNKKAKGNLFVRIPLENFSFAIELI